MRQTKPPSVSRTLISTGRTVQWFNNNVRKLPLGLSLVIVVCYWLTTYMLERRFIAEIATLRAQGQPVTAADLIRPKIPDKQNGAVVFAKAFKILESKDGSKAALTLKLMMTGKRQVAVPMTQNTDIPSRRVSLQQTLQGVPITPRKSSAPERIEQGLTPWPEVIQAAKQLAGVVPIAREALTRPDCQFPIDPNSDTVKTPKHYANIRALVGVLSALAVVDAHDGKMDQAYEKINLAFNTAQANRKEQTLMNAFVTIVGIEIANNGLRKVLEYGIPTPAQAASLNRLLSNSKVESMLVYALQGERALSLTKANLWATIYMPEGLKGIDQVSPRDKQRGSSLYGYLMRPVVYFNNIKGLRAMSQTISIADRRYPNVKQQQEELTKVETRIAEDTMTNIVFPVYINVVMKPHGTRVRTALTQILLAAQQYKARNGQYPDTMAQVRSAGVEDIPIDPFTGRDFVYRRTAKGFTVYSVGDDFKDDGGISRSARKRGEDSWDIVLTWER